MALQPVPRMRRTLQNTQHTYSLGRRIYDVKTYPVQSPQGATILIYGHENGATVVWRGGRRLKPPKPQTNEKRNGTKPEDAVMIIDSDDETGPTFVDKPEFEDSPLVADGSVAEIIQTLDLALGTAVNHIAVLPMPPCAAEDASWNGANILKTKIVFAVTCATNDVYVITLPLTPPSHEAKARPELRKSLLAGNAGKGVWGETLTLLTGPSRSCNGVAISLVKHRSSSRSRSSERSAAQAAPITRVVVAAHSREASGTLRLWDVPLEAKPGTINRVEPFQTEYLPSPLTSISFNPVNLTQLLTVASPHAVRIYDYATASLPSDDTSEGPFPSQGSWLISLYPPFARGPAMSTSRKPIVAAEWIARGRAILTLLADGQWGIWDLDGASPTAAGGGSNLFSKTSAGLRGTAITAFSVTGHLEGTSPLRNPTTQKASSSSSGEFVPMTPHTRRDAIATAFGGSPEKLAAVRGGITVAQLPSTPTSGAGDESAVLFLGGADPIVCVIPVLSKFWDSQLRRAAGGGVNLWSGAQPTRMIRLTDLSAGLLGERCTGAVAITKAVRANASTNGILKEDDSSGSQGLPIEVLLQGESRLVIVHENGDAPTSSLTSRLLGARKKQRDEFKSVNAIVAYPPLEKPSVSFNLNLTQRPEKPGTLFAPRSRHFKSLFEQSIDTIPSTDAGDEETIPATSAPSSQQGFMFATDLELAADLPDDEADAEGRDVEQELLDIMEIDRELEQLEQARERGRKRVFFEEG